MDANEFAEVFPAGDYISDELEARGWSQTDFAEILGRPVQFVSEVISGKKEITRESAAQIGEALETSAQYWLNLQDIYLLWHQLQDLRVRTELEDVRRRARLRDYAPISLLAKRGFLRSESIVDQEREVNEMYAVPELGKEEFAIAARRSNLDEALTPVQLAWVRSVRKRALENLPTAIFDEVGLRRIADRLSQDLQDPAALVDVPQRLAAVGVRLVYVESFPGSKFDGCSFLLDGVPVIGLSGRGQRFDKVLFSLLHELAHILLGHLDHEELIVDDLDRKETVGDEAEADRQAAEWALPKPLPSRIPQRVGLDWVLAAARERGVHPIVVVGRLQRLRKVSWKTTLVRGAPSAVDHLRLWR